MSRPDTLAVVLPTWDMRRALSRVVEMQSLEQHSGYPVDYVLVVPKAENLPFSEWPDGADPEDESIYVIETVDYLSPTEAMAVAGKQLLQHEAELTRRSVDLIAFLHDDVLVEQSGWNLSVIKHFAHHPQCGLAGFGGGIGFADIDIYKVPYDYRQLARVDFVSNMREAESHGRRVSEPMRVAALDGFALVTSREFYERAGCPIVRGSGGERVGAWDVCLGNGVPYHMYDAWISCRAAELGYEVWMLPIACHHQGGQTSVSRQAEYAQVVKRLGYASAEELYAKGHEAIYKRFAGVLPIRVKENSDGK